MIWPDFTTFCGFTLPVYQDVLSKNHTVFDTLHLKREGDSERERRGREKEREMK